MPLSFGIKYLILRRDNINEDYLIVFKCFELLMRNRINLKCIKMKRLLSLATVASIALSVNAYGYLPYQDKDYSDWGKLKLVDNQLSDKDGNLVQLKGWSTFSLHYKGYCGGEGQWKLMKQYGANIVRLAMYIDDPNDGGSYITKPEYFKNLIKQSIEETRSLNMYCIVDWHITPDSLLSGDPNDYISESKDFFGEISKYCSDNGYDNVLYEICNNPTCGWSNIKGYAEEVIPVITANQPDAIIIVGTDQWCQKIMEPILNPIDPTYKKNVMYAFHYAACSHYSLLGDFRNAQKKIPVFVSEWSAVKFDGEGPFCASNSDELIAACDKIDAAPQLVSWCIWNWGSKREASSFFQDNCSVNNLSQYIDNSGKKYSDYVIELMMGGPICCAPPPCCTPWTVENLIPTTESSLWRWDYYDLGGEAMTYHDANSGAWVTDTSGVVIDYSNEGEEVDVFSLASKMMWLDKKCPWSTVENGKVVAFDSTISTMWKDENGNPSYKSLNAGRYYYGTDGSDRPDDGVDLNYASCKGTDYENLRYNSLYRVEKNEWINYTVKVAKPGYYKISGIISSEYKAPLKNGEISIISNHGNHLRDTSALKDDKIITSFGFPRTTVCDDATVADSAYWDCWTKSDAISGDHKEVLCVFDESGVQEITIKFKGDASGVGPLIFDWYADLDPEDPITCGDCGGWFFDDEDEPGSVDDVNVTKFSINPNPTSGEFTIILADDAEATVDVVNMAGQIVVSQKIEGTAKINKALPAGVYTVVVKSNGGISAQKLVVK